MIKPIRLGLRLLHLTCVLLLGILLGAWVGCLETLLHRALPDLRQRLSRWFLACLSRALPLQVRITGIPPQQPMLWVSNHVSWLDIPLLGMLAPLSFLSKAEVRQWPLLGWLAGKAGTLFIQRGGNRSAEVNRELCAHLQQQRHLLLFPEGSTSDGSYLRAFHPRLLASAIDSGVALQPVAIRYVRNGRLCQLSPFIDDDDLLRHLLRLLSHEAVEVEIRLLEPIPSQAASRDQLARQARERIGLALYGEAA
jgi:1-acyl-sn-glycerol-3-phosphate acyltransferase